MRLLCQRFCLATSLMSTSNVSSCRVFTVSCREAVVYERFDRTACDRGAAFLSTFLLAPPELYETGTIQKHWNRATKYAETKRVHEVGAEVQPLECGLKIAVTACNASMLVLRMYVPLILLD